MGDKSSTLTRRKRERGREGANGRKRGKKRKERKREEKSNGVKYLDCTKFSRHHLKFGCQSHRKSEIGVRGRGLEYGS